MTEEKKSVGGAVRIHPDVIAQYAGQEAMECFGVVGLGAVSEREGIWRILKPDRLSHGVSVTATEGKLTVGIHIIVAYGVSIPAVSENLREMLVYKLESFTGMKVDSVNIYVEGIRVVD